MNDQPNLLDLSDESDAFVSLRHAVVVPPCPDSNSRESRSGVLDAQGQMVAQSISWTSSSRAVNSAPSVPTEGVRDLPGRYAFGGIFMVTSVISSSNPSPGYGCRMRWTAGLTA